MSAVNSSPPYELHRGDCLEVLKTMADNSVDSIVTDPPYGLRFMGKRWDYDVPATEVWAECLRVLKPGGHLLAFAGTRTQHRMAVRIEDAGFEIRDMIAWVYGSGFPKSHNGEWGGTALKPALEPITVARKPLCGTVEASWREYGTGALNIDGCRVLAEQMPPNTGAGGLPRRNTEEHRGAGVVSQPHSLGRWPANLIHDGSDEVAALFPESTSGAMKNGTQRAAQDGPGSVCYGTYGGNATSVEIAASKGSAARFFYCAKASRSDRNEGTEDLPQISGGMVSNTSGQHITRRDEGYEAKPQGNHHPTVKPTDLCCYLQRLVTPPGGTTMDLYMGSGSFGKAAMREGFYFIGIERDEDENGQPLGYMDISRARIAHELQRKRALAAQVADESFQLDIFSDPN